MIGTREKQGEWQREGLTAREVEQSRREHGTNALEGGKRKSFLRQLIGNFGDPIIRVLLIALGVNVLVLFPRCNWFETGGILLAVALSTLVSTLSEWGSERAFEKLRASSAGGKCRVRREGRVEQIEAEELVVGDCLCLQAGEMIQADGRVVFGEVSVDQAALNGESAEAVKRPCGPQKEWDLACEGQVFRGSVVVGGSACVRVERVGKATFYGALAEELQTDTRESPLKVRLSRLAGQISRIGYVMAALVALAYLFGAFVLSFDFDGAAIRAALSDRTFVIGTLIHTVTLVITVVVVAVPEGLPMMITVVLSSNMRRMVKDGVLVRKMVGIETAGSLNILFTDKTGTLTCGKMSVCGTLCGGGVFYRGRRALQGAPAIRQALCRNAMWNTESSMTDAGAVGGNATDRAILEYFYDPMAEEAQILDRRPFTSESKMAAVKTPSGVYVKGAPDVLLPHVTTYLAPDGTERPFTREEAQTLKRLMATQAVTGERLVALCNAERFGKTGVPSGLCLVGILLLRDPLRPEAERSVATLHKAGVQVVMVTGDGESTAVAIARECGLATGGEGEVISGRELAQLEDGELMRRLPHLRVVYRALPGDKSRLVRLAQRLGLVTGMTGDGVNDAPSLKLADVGFAMGSGTDIAREAGDIVILDDNIASICKTVLYGRTIFKSIRKFVTFQLTMNLCAVGVSLLGQFIGIENPVTIIQMLWVNIIMDTLGGLAFAGEAPMAFYMRERPKQREEQILSRSMLHQITLTGAYTLGLCVWFLVSPFCAVYFRRGSNEVYFLTVFFALFIFCGIANSFCARSERMSIFAGLGRNRAFLLIMGLICGVQIAMIYLGGTLFRTTPLALGDLLWTVGMALTVIPVDFLRRLFLRLGAKK
ncbi:MAG: calcium-translocating P-type ATPase, PMCA-type [Clostridia bacterium]|nr:calcium-translocating P-type ATPase, PMCA-type [Clostridia bacterium]